MRYSIYNPETKLYDYYVGPGPKGTHAGAPPVRGKSAMGATIEQASWHVPVSAKKMGSGVLPVGRIATSGMSGFDGFDDKTTLAVLGVVGAILAWRYLR